MVVVVVVILGEGDSQAFLVLGEEDSLLGRLMRLQRGRCSLFHRRLERLQQVQGQVQKVGMTTTQTLQVVTPKRSAKRNSNLSWNSRKLLLPRERNTKSVCLK